MKTLAANTRRVCPVASLVVVLLAGITAVVPAVADSATAPAPAAPVPATRAPVTAPAAVPPTPTTAAPRTLGDRLEAVTIRDFSFPDITTRDLVGELEKLVRQHAQPCGYTLRWQVTAAKLDQPDRRLMVDMTDVPLRALVTQVAAIAGLRVTAAGSMFSITDRDITVEPLQTQTFQVVPEFWAMLDENIDRPPVKTPTAPGAAGPPAVSQGGPLVSRPGEEGETGNQTPGLEPRRPSPDAIPELFGPEVRALPRFDPGRVRAFLTATGAEFPVGATVAVAPDHRAVTITSTGAGLGKVGEFLRVTYATPATWRLHAMLVRFDDPRQLPAAGDLRQAFANHEAIQTLLENKNAVLADFATDTHDLVPDEHTMSTALPGGATLHLEVRLHPRQALGNYEGTQFDLWYDCRIVAADGTERAGSTGEHTLRIAQSGLLRIPLPCLLPMAGTTEPRLNLVIRPEFALGNSRANHDSSPDAGHTVSRDEHARVQRLLTEIRLPKVEFDEMPVQDAFRWLAGQSRALDPDKKGVPISLIRSCEAEKPRTITMTMNNIPLGEVLRYICLGAGLRYEIESAVAILDKPLPFDQFTTEYYITQRSMFESAADTQPVIDKAPEAFFAGFGIEFPQGSWVHVLSFRFGYVIAVHNSPRQLRKMAEIMQTIDGPLCFDGQVAVRFQVLEIEDVQALARVRALCDTNSPTMRAEFERLCVRLSRGHGARVLFADFTLTAEQPGFVEWRRRVGGDVLETRLTAVATQDTDLYGLSVKVDWTAVAQAGVSSPRRVLGRWLAEWDTADVNATLLPAPGLAASPVGADRTFVLVMPYVVNGYGHSVRTLTGEDEEKTLERTPEAPAVGKAPSDPDTGVDDYGDTRVYTWRGQLQSLVGTIATLPFTGTGFPSEYVTFNPRVSKVIVYGTAKFLAQFEELLPRWWADPERQLKVSVGRDATLASETVLYLRDGRLAVITLPPVAAGGVRQELALQMAEPLAFERYAVTWRLADLGTMPAEPLAHAPAPVPVPLGETVKLSDTLFIRVQLVSPFGGPVEKPFAKAVTQHNDERRKRAETLEGALKPLAAVNVSEFSLKEATLETAVAQLQTAARGYARPPESQNTSGARAAARGYARPPEKQEASPGPPAVPAISYASLRAKRTLGEQEKEQEQEQEKNELQREKGTVDLLDALAKELQPFAAQTVTLTAKNSTLAELVRLVRDRYHCRAEAGPDGIVVSAVPDVIVARHPVAKERFAAAKDGDARQWLAGRGVVFSVADRVLYLPAYDLLLATGTDAFLAAVRAALER